MCDYLKTYVPGRQERKRRDQAGDTVQNPVGFNTVAGRGRDKGDTGKRCDYCIGKGWKGFNHTESEYFTKEREKKKVKKFRSKGKGAESDEDSGSDTEGVTIKALRIGKTKVGRKGCYEYDTAAIHHTTNKYNRLIDVEHNLEVKVTAHDKTVSI